VRNIEITAIEMLKPENKEKLRVAAYCRVSTDKKDQESSFENQFAYFEEIISKKGHQLIKIYGDDGLTGTKLNNRSSLNEMLKDAGVDIIECYKNDLETTKYGNLDKRMNKEEVIYRASQREPKFDEIWIKNTARFARNILCTQIVTALRKKGVFIYFVDQDINTKTNEKDVMLYFFQMIDAQDSIDKSIKVRFGQRQCAETKKTILTNDRIYGYHYIKETNSLEIIEEEKNVICLIYKLYTENYGLHRIEKYLNDNNIKTRNNQPFCKSSIRRILTNEKYYGANLRFKYTYGSIANKFSYAKINKEEDIIKQENHDRIPAIISKEMFNRVQEILHSNTNYLNQKGQYKGISRYSGLLFCGECGAKYYSNVDKGRRFYCCSGKKSSDKRCCSSPNIGEKVLDELLSPDNVYKLLRDSYNCTQSILMYLKGTLKKQINNSDLQKANSLKTELDNEIQNESTLMNYVFQGKITEETYDKMRLPIISNIKRLKSSIENVCMNNDELIATIEDITREQKKYKEEMDTYVKEIYNKMSTPKFDSLKKLELINKIVVCINPEVAHLSIGKTHLQIEFKFTSDIWTRYKKYLDMMQEMFGYPIVYIA